MRVPIASIPRESQPGHILHREFLGKHRRTEALHPSLPGTRALARTVLCLHGLTRNSRDFEDLAPHLQQQYRVIVPDVRGRGLSARDPNPQNYQPAIYLQDILALMDTVDAQRVAIIGTSMGGMLAMMMAVGSRDRVSGVVLNDMGPEVDPTGLERIKGYAGRLPAPKNLGRGDCANSSDVRQCLAESFPRALVGTHTPRLIEKM